MGLETEHVQKLLEPQAGFLAKSDGTPLWSHHYTAWWVMRHFCEHLPSLDEDERTGLELAALLHDVGKTRPEVQAYLRGVGPKKPHKPTREEIFAAIRQSEIWDKAQSAKLADFAHGVTVGHHYLAEQDIRDMNLDTGDSYLRLLITTDHLSSMNRIDARLVNTVNNHFPFFDLSAVEISRFPSPTSFLLQQQVREAYEKAGWALLLTYADGQIFIGPPQNPLPDKAALVEKIHQDFLEQILSLQAPNPANFTNAMIAGPALEYPGQFFEVYKERIFQGLNQSDTAPFWFFKPIVDLLSDNKSMEVWNKNTIVMKILRGSGSTASISKAKLDWANHSQLPIPDKQGHLPQMFGRVILKEILPEHLRGGARDGVPLSDLYADELLRVLETVFKCEEVRKNAPPDTLPEQFDELLSMEEEKDFTGFAQERFDRYRGYKKTANYEKGLCERCGSPFAQPVKPALNFPSDVKNKVFTQIKSNAQKETATCTLCVYDNSILRQGLGNKYSPVFLRLRCLYPRNPEEIGGLEDFIETVWRGIAYPWKMVRRGDGLLPKGTLLPVPSEKSKPRENRFNFLPHESHPTLLMGVLERTPREGPKELKAKYAPLYHLLRLMGFETDIGMEEQVGLLGERVTTTPEAYQQALAAVVLAKAMSSKKNKPFTAAANLLDGNLSVAITMVAEGDYMSVELQRTFFDTIQYQPLIKGKEEWTVKDLLQDAAFLADRENGLWFFCVEFEERSGEITKHLATKPIAQAMNILLRSRDPEEALPLAIATFDSHLRRNIPKERGEDLERFTRGAHAILRKYAQLRKENFQQFLKIRNALMSAVFTYTRYPQLSKEV